MSVDSNRAVFVKNEYRYDVAEDLSVQANYPTAQELQIDTSLSNATAAALAATYLAGTKTPALAWEVEIDGILRPEDFATTVNQYTLNFPLHATDSARTYKLIGAKVDYAKNITTLRLRG